MNGKICLDKRIIILSAVLVVAILLVIVNTTVMNANVANNSRASGLSPTSVLNRKPTGVASVTPSPLVTPAPLTRSVAVCLSPKESSVKGSTDLFLKPGMDPAIFAKDRMVSIVGVKPGGGAELLTLVPVPEVSGARIAVLENKQFAKNTAYRFVATQKADPDMDQRQKVDNYEAWVIASSKNCVAYQPPSR